MRVLFLSIRGFRLAMNRLSLVAGDFLLMDERPRHVARHCPASGGRGRLGTGRLPVTAPAVGGHARRLPATPASLPRAARQSLLTVRHLRVAARQWRGASPGLLGVARQWRGTFPSPPIGAGRWPLRLRRLPAVARQSLLRAPSSPSLPGRQPAMPRRRRLAHSPCRPLSLSSGSPRLPLFRISPLSPVSEIPPSAPAPHGTVG